jgi:hypothetical protein
MWHARRHDEVTLATYQQHLGGTYGGMFQPNSAPEASPENSMLDEDAMATESTEAEWPVVSRANRNHPRDQKLAFVRSNAEGSNFAA